MSLENQFICETNWNLYYKWQEVFMSEALGKNMDHY